METVSEDKSATKAEWFKGLRKGVRGFQFSLFITLLYKFNRQSRNSSYIWIYCHVFCLLDWGKDGKSRINQNRSAGGSEASLRPAHRQKTNLQLSCLSVRQGVRLTSRLVPTGLWLKPGRGRGHRPAHHHHQRPMLVHLLAQQMCPYCSFPPCEMLLQF